MTFIYHDTRGEWLDEVVDLRKRVHSLERENDRLREERDRAIVARNEAQTLLMRLARSGTGGDRG